MSDGDGTGRRRVMLGIKMYPETIEKIRQLGLKRYPEMNERRVMSQAGRDLIALGFAALEAGFVPGEPIPKKRLAP